MKLSHTAGRILCRGLDDWVQLVDVIHEVGSSGELLTLAELRERSLGVVAELVEAELMVIGDVTAETGFVQWPPMASHRQLERIRERWDSLSRQPILGDVCWLDLTDSGRRYAEKLSAAAEDY